MSEGNELLMSGGIPSFSYKNTQVGHSFTGVVDRDPETRAQTDYNTGEPVYWNDGSPKMQVVVTVKTNLTNGEGTSKAGKLPQDDGLRRFYLRWHSLEAVRTAVRDANADGLKPGGELTLTFSGTEPSQKGEPAKLYTASYTPPVSGGNETLMAEASPPVTAAAATPHVDQAAAANLINQLSPEQKAQLGIS